MLQLILYFGFGVICISKGLKELGLWKSSKKKSILIRSLVLICTPILVFCFGVGYEIYKESKYISYDKIVIDGIYRIEYCPICTENERLSNEIIIDKNNRYQVKMNGILSKEIGLKGLYNLVPIGEDMEIQFNTKLSGNVGVIQRGVDEFSIVIWYGDPDGDQCIILKK